MCIVLGIFILFIPLVFYFAIVYIEFAQLNILYDFVLECLVYDMQAVLEETQTRTIRSCAWSPSGKLLAAASFDATTAIWEQIGDDFECVSTLEVLFDVVILSLFYFES